MTGMPKCWPFAPSIGFFTITNAIANWWADHPSYLIQECHDLAISGLQIPGLLRRRDESEMTESLFQPFAIAEDTRIHMYSSEAPCTISPAVPRDARELC